MSAQESHSAQAAELAAVLRIVAITDKQLADLRQLYETPLGFSYTVDGKNAPQNENIKTCRTVGSAIKKALGVSTAKPYGMNFIGYCDGPSSTWRMKPAFRAAIESLEWFETHQVDQMEAIDTDFQLRIEKSQADSATARQARLATAPRMPKRIAAMSYVFDRNPDVVAETLARAQGKCEGCGKSAPFLKKKDAQPYLEVHHRLQLSRNGEDTVENAIALCPNCHRERHFG